MACLCPCGASSAFIDGLTDNGAKDDGRLVFYRFVRAADCYVGFIQMKKLFLFAVFFLLLLPLAKAENIIQLTGGNYIFAEEGKLVFNIDPEVFLNRNWRYDASKGGATTLFYQKMDFKTRHSNDFHAYDMAAARKYYEDYHYAKSNGQNGYGFYKLVYTKEHLNKRHIRRVVWPAVWAGVVRVGGIVLENVIPRVVVKCFTNITCRTASGVTAAHICFLKLGEYVGLPKGICSEAEKDGFKKDENGEYKKPAGEYFYRVNYYLDCNGHCTPSETKDFSTEEEAIAFAQEAVENVYKRINAKEKPQKEWQCTSKYVLRDKEGNAGCSNNYGGGHSMIISKQKREQPYSMTIVDLEQFALKDFKQHPNDYINDERELGKEIRKEIQPIQGDINTGGTLSIVGEPYRDGNGATKQDVITVNAPSDWSNSSPGGNASNPTGGISITNNNSNVHVMNRPDKEADSKPAANNDPNNGKSVGQNGQSGGNTAGGGQSGQKGENCPEGSDSLACAKLGDIDANDKGFEIPHSDNGTTWEPDYFLQTTAVCPQPRQFQVAGQTYEFKYDQVCGFAEKIKYIIIVLATISAGFIVFGGKKD